MVSCSEIFSELNVFCITRSVVTGLIARTHLPQHPPASAAWEFAALSLSLTCFTDFPVQIMSRWNYLPSSPEVLDLSLSRGFYTSSSVSAGNIAKLGPRRSRIFLITAVKPPLYYKSSWQDKCWCVKQTHQGWLEYGTQRCSALWLSGNLGLSNLTSCTPQGITFHSEAPHSAV